jgi:hypothetical protein
MDFAIATIVVGAAVAGTAIVGTNTFLKRNSDDDNSVRETTASSSYVSNTNTVTQSTSTNNGSTDMPADAVKAKIDAVTNPKDFKTIEEEITKRNDNDPKSTLKKMLKNGRLSFFDKIINDIKPTEDSLKSSLKKVTESSTSKIPMTPDNVSDNFLKSWNSNLNKFMISNIKKPTTESAIDALFEKLFTKNKTGSKAGDIAAATRTLATEVNNGASEGVVQGKIDEVIKAYKTTHIRS